MEYIVLDTFDMKNAREALVWALILGATSPDKAEERRAGRLVGELLKMIADEELELAIKQAEKELSEREGEEVILQ